MSTPKGIRLLNAIESYSKNARRWDTNHIFTTVKISMVANGCMTGSFVVTEDLCNAAKTLHGGFSSSVVDAFAVFSYLSHKQGAIGLTTDMNMIYLNAGVIGDTIQVQSQPIRVTKGRAVMDCLLTSQTTGKLLARGTVSLQAADAKTVLTVDKLPFNPNEN